MTPIALLLALACTPDPKPAPEEDTSPAPGDSAPPVDSDAPTDTDTAVEQVPDPCEDADWPDLRLNELLAANLSGIADGSGETPDWVELVNRADAELDLADWSLEDEGGNDWTFASLPLGPGEILLLWADGEDSQGDPASGGEVHLSFSLEAEHPGVRLLAPDGCLVDEASPGRLYGDVSFGRASDDASAWEYFLEPTPGEENSTESRPAFAETPTLSPEAGLYEGELEVVASSSEDGALIYVSTDGGAPDEEDELYTGGLVVDGSSQPAVVRARAYVDGLWPSRVASATYADPGVLEAGMYVVSLIVEPDDLWSDEAGIYAYGPEDYETWYPYFGANFWEDWERPVAVQVWDAAGDLVVDQDAGLSIHGGYTRAFDQKSFRLYARSAYGPGEFSGKFFETEEIDTFQTLVLQIGMDWCGTHLQEMTLPTLLRDGDGKLLPSVDATAWAPAQVWLNGEYWGYYNFRERLDGDWIESHHGVDADEVDRVELGWTHDANWELEQGSWDNFYALNDFVEAADLSDPDDWAAFDAMVDLDSLASAVVAEAWIGNTDWWYNNLRLWRPTAEDGQWRWMIYDFGHGWTSVGYDQIATSVTWSGDGLPIADALENEEFRALLANHASDLLNTSLRGEHAQEVFDEMVAQAEPAMEAHFDRWCSGGIGAFHSSVTYAHSFVKLREDALRDQVAGALGLEGTAEVSLSSDPEGAGRFQLSAVSVDAPFSGTFYTGIPVTITAVPAAGYAFVGWSDDALGDTPTVEVELDGDASYTAVFAAE